MFTFLKSKEDQLISYAKSGNLDEIKNLVSKGVDINYLSRTQKKSAIWHASNAGHKHITEYLEAKQQENKINDLLKAAYNGHIRTVDHLVSKGLDINSVNKDGANALLLAAANGQKEMFEHLLTKGV